MINKPLLFTQIISALQLNHKRAVEAAMRAYNTATNNENVAENKYDTLALEASYLAHGQAQRVAQCEADIMAFKKLDISAKSTVVLGSLVELIDQQDKYKYLFIGPSAGGLKAISALKEVVIVTPNSPLGCALMGREQDNEISVKIGELVVDYEIVMIC